MQVTHQVLDLIYTEEEGQESFSGTYQECEKFISEQGGITSTFKIIPIMKKESTYKYKDWNVKINHTCYSNNRSALQLIDTEDGLPITTATVNIPEYDLKDGHVLIKSWSENEGMAVYLQEQGVIGPAIDMVPTGHTYATLHKLLI